MAYHLAALIQCDDSDQCDQLKSLLDRETRPLFEKDVPPNQHQLFQAIEDIDYPEESEFLDQGLWLFWHQVDNFGFEQLKELLESFGLSASFIFEVVDYPMSGDSNEDEASGTCWIRQGNDYTRVSRNVTEDTIGSEIIERLPA